MQMRVARRTVLVPMRMQVPCMTGGPYAERNQHNANTALQNRGCVFRYAGTDPEKHQAGQDDDTAVTDGPMHSKPSSREWRGFSSCERSDCRHVIELECVHRTKQQRR